jgi:hypothetical protein
MRPYGRGETPPIGEKRGENPASDCKPPPPLCYAEGEVAYVGGVVAVAACARRVDEGGECDVVVARGGGDGLGDAEEGGGAVRRDEEALVARLKIDEDVIEKKPGGGCRRTLVGARGGAQDLTWEGGGVSDWHGETKDKIAHPPPLHMATKMMETSRRL